MIYFIFFSYNLFAKIELRNEIHENTHVYAQNGELFAKVPLEGYLSEDTDAGKLILLSVKQVLFSPRDSNDNVVYEADIVREENFNYDGRGRDFIYLCLSRNCVSQLRLSPGISVEVEIQFQMNRSWFVKMHYAVDQLKETDIIFPNISKVQTDWIDRDTFRIR